MTIIETILLDNVQKAAVLDLWQQEYPAQLRYDDPVGFDTYLNNLSYPMHYLAFDAETMVGWAFTFDRDAERWFAIIVHRNHQKKGIGKKLIDTLKRHEKVLNGWVTDHDRYVKSDGSAYPSPLNFYSQNGFNVLHDIRLETEKLSAVKIIWKAE